MPAPSSARLFVISAPSGAGKTSLVKALRERLPELRVSTSHTTRPPRPNEQDGREYYFVTNEEFDRLVADGAFLEHARVFDNQYGTGLRPAARTSWPRATTWCWRSTGRGRARCARALPDCRTIFILPPSREALRQRLTGRGTDSPAVIERRLADAVTDMGHYGEFDYVVVNDEFARAVDQLVQIVRGTGESLAARPAGALCGAARIC